MLHLSTFLTRPVLAALALATVSAVAVHAEDAKPDPALANSINSNDQTSEKEPELLKKNAAVKVEDGKYIDADGHPTFHITNDGKKARLVHLLGLPPLSRRVPRLPRSGRHGFDLRPGPQGFAEALSYEEFVGILAGGKQDVSASDQKVMPAFGDNKNVICYSDDLYVYLKARASGAIGRIRPNEKEDKPEAAKKNEKECMGG